MRLTIYDAAGGCFDLVYDNWKLLVRDFTGSVPKRCALVTINNIVSTHTGLIYLCLQHRAEEPITLLGEV